MHRQRLFAFLLLGALAGGAGAEPDAALLGQAQGYPLAPGGGAWYRNPYRVGSWSALDKVPGIRSEPVAHAAQPRPLEPMADAPTIAYGYKNTRWQLADYLEHQRATGLLVLKDGRIVAEHYRYGRTPEARFLSFSMAKSVTSLLVGAALQRGLIASLDEPAERYAKELAGSPYGATPLRALLRMSSGLTFSERYDGQDDIARLSRAAASATPGEATQVLRSISGRHAAAGSSFVYASAETAVLGRVLEGATGKSLAVLTREWLWQPIGAERDAFWVVDAEGHAGAWGYFNAALRDWGRLGLMLADDGVVAGREVVPRDYLLDATDAARQPEAFRPRRATPYNGYGYQFWLLPMRERTFALQGVHGQMVFVQPASHTVMVITSAWEPASGKQDPTPWQETDALWRGVLRSLGAATD